MRSRDDISLETLENRLRALLPEEYQDTYDEVQPVSMGSAPLKYGPDGNVAWDEVWGSFCDLAMAGGPPHKGLLLEPGSPAEIDAQPDRYREVVQEICRGITLATDLDASPSPNQGWVRVACENETMAGWLLRAISMENVSVRMDGAAIDLPAGPAYRLDKEIKNVITVIAKTSHYWLGHMWRVQRLEIAHLFAVVAEGSPLLGPGTSAEAAGDGGAAPNAVADDIERRTGLAAVFAGRYPGWLGVECTSARAALWMMRMLVADNVLARREGTVLFVPLDPAADPGGRLMTAALGRVHGFAAAKGILEPRSE